MHNDTSKQEQSIMLRVNIMCQYACPTGTRSILQAALQSQDVESIKIRYKQYDWTTNSANVST